MQRRNFIKTAGLLTGLLTLPFMKSSAQSPSEKIKFRHVVYFWLNEPDNIEKNRLFLKNLKEFIEGMDNIIDPYIGSPADTNRDVVDNTYQYCLNLGFANKAQHDIYQDHHLHKLFIEKSVHLWKRVVVYDSVPV